MDKIYTDIAIIGGGAAGLAAGAVLARENKYTTVILEHSARTGKKILSTGNGRCNLSHSPLFGGKQCYFGEPEFAKKIIGKADSAEQFFKKLGLRCRTDNEGRVYPYSNTAASVSDALRLAAANGGIKELCEFTAVRLEPLMEGFLIISDNKENPQIAARRVIFSAGGKAQSPCDGFDLLRNLKVDITPLYPSLCPVKTDERLTRPLKNLRVKARASIKRTDGKSTEKIASETGEVQFGEGILSGIAVFNLSRLCLSNNLVISLDLTPDINYEGLIKYITNILEIRNTASLSDLLTGLFQKRIGEVLLKQVTDKPLNTSLKNLTRNEIERLAKLIKNWDFPVCCTIENELSSADWKAAQITNGGVPARELTEDLALKKYPHMFIAGEAVNVFGDCGGYNLAWAWASGEIAAKAAAVSLY